MLDALRKLMLAGLGTIDLTEEKLKAVIDDLVARGEVSEKEAREAIADWKKRAGEHSSRIQQQVDEAVGRALDRVGVVRRSEFDALAARLADLERRVAPSPDAS